MNASTAPNATSLPLGNFTQALSTITYLVNATTLPNATSTQQSKPFSVSPTFSTTQAPVTHETQKCQSFEYDFDQNIPVTAVCGLCFLFGVLLVFVGTLRFIFDEGFRMF